MQKAAKVPAVAEAQTALIDLKDLTRHCDTNVQKTVKLPEVNAAMNVFPAVSQSTIGFGIVGFRRSHSPKVACHWMEQPSQSIMALRATGGCSGEES